jgi:hypothetical protein
MPNSIIVAPAAWSLAPKQLRLPASLPSNLTRVPVGGLGCVRARSNLYSAPALPGRTVEVRLSIRVHVELRDEDRCIARHEPCYQRQQQVLDLEH